MPIDIALAKAFKAAGVRKSTVDIMPAMLPGQPASGIQNLHDGRLTTLWWRPLMRHGAVVGAVGVSSGSVADDLAVAQAAARSFNAVE